MFEEVGSVEVRPQDREVLVGSFSLEADDDTIWFKVTQTSPTDVWTYAYGLLTWRSCEGQELGTVKVHGHTNSEVVALGVGLPPVERTGDVFFTPRAWNRRWISIDNPPLWGLTFEAQSGLSGVGSPSFGSKSTLTTLSDLVGHIVDFVISDSFARLALTSFLKLPPG